MLKLLLDEHVSPAVADGLRKRNPSLLVFCLSTWGGGEFLGQPDAVCLERAALHGLTLVTYDRRTIPPLLKKWAEEERTHGGMSFIDEKTISPAETGALVSALDKLAREMGTWNWTSRVCFLRR